MAFAYQCVDWTADLWIGRPIGRLIGRLAVSSVGSGRSVAGSAAWSVDRSFGRLVVSSVGEVGRSADRSVDRSFGRFVELVGVWSGGVGLGEAGVWWGG